MLADEAHHFNAKTSSKENQQKLDLKLELTENSKKEEIERLGWEHTIIELILNKNNKKIENKNVLLEFTATIPTNEQVAKHYNIGLKTFQSYLKAYKDEKKKGKK